MPLAAYELNEINTTYQLPVHTSTCLHLKKTHFAKNSKERAQLHSIVPSSGCSYYLSLTIFIIYQTDQ